MRRALAGLLAVLALLALPQAASAGDPVKDRQAAQKRANAAAAKWSRAQAELARVERDLAKLEADKKATQARLSGLEAKVREVAVNQYVHGGLSTTFMFDQDASRAARSQAFARFVALGDTDAIDAYRAAQEDLETGSAAVRKRIEEKRSAATSLRKQAASAEAELKRLAAAEKAYLAKIEAEKAAAARRAAAQRRASSRSATAAPAPSTGRVTGVIATGEWVCPVQGPRAFSNDYGQPRSGGRRHQGNDILSPRGTPVVASVGGSVKHHNSSLGGLSYYLSGDDGNVYFGTHLSAFGQGGRVSAGAVIGYVGDTGNARGTPHLHFEIHPGGGGPVNPYPTLVKYC